MESFLKPLLEHAFGRAAASDANRAIEDAREQEGERSRSFEIVVAPDAGIAWLQEELLPRLVYHLESLGVRPPGYSGIFVSLFVGDEIHFVRTRDVMAFATAALSLSADEMYARWGTHELRHAVKLGDEGPLLALPPGKGE